jgi:hypothetical protein
MSKDELVSQSNELLVFDNKTRESLSFHDSCNYETATIGEDLGAQDVYDEINVSMEPKTSMPDTDDFPSDVYGNYTSAQVM